MIIKNISDRPVKASWAPAFARVLLPGQSVKVDRPLIAMLQDRDFLILTGIAAQAGITEIATPKGKGIVRSRCAWGELIYANGPQGDRPYIKCQTKPENQFGTALVEVYLDRMDSYILKMLSGAKDMFVGDTDVINKDSESEVIAVPKTLNRGAPALPQQAKPGTIKPPAVPVVPKSTKPATAWPLNSTGGAKVPEVAQPLTVKEFIEENKEEVKEEPKVEEVKVETVPEAIKLDDFVEPVKEEVVQEDIKEEIPVEEPVKVKRAYNKKPKVEVVEEPVTEE